MKAILEDGRTINYAAFTAAAPDKKITIQGNDVLAGEAGIKTVFTSIRGIENYSTVEMAKVAEAKKAATARGHDLDLRNL